MEKLYKQGENIQDLINIGDVIEIKSGIFIKVKIIETIIEEDLAGTKKTNVFLKGEILKNGER